ncbi:hypothetical protein Pelo_3154 [Pelomyxa schiedti]|nr:hypothetical protein Pelo_3154 [Pelomyxa schiedti]
MIWAGASPPARNARQGGRGRQPGRTSHPTLPANNKAESGTVSHDGGLDMNPPPSSREPGRRRRATAHRALPRTGANTAMKIKPWAKLSLFQTGNREWLVKEVRATFGSDPSCSLLWNDDVSRTAGVKPVHFTLEMRSASGGPWDEPGNKKKFCRPLLICHDRVEIGSGSINEIRSSCGTPGYQAPEMLEQVGDKPRTALADMWSTGAVLYYCFEAEPPFKNLQEMKEGKLQFKSQSWNNVSAKAKQLIAKLLSCDLSERPNCEQALQHAWFTSPEEPGVANSGASTVNTTSASNVAEPCDNLPSAPRGMMSPQILIPTHEQHQDPRAAPAPLLRSPASLAASPPPPLMPPTHPPHSQAQSQSHYRYQYQYQDQYLYQYQSQPSQLPFDFPCGAVPSPFSASSASSAFFSSSPSSTGKSPETDGVDEI